MLKLAWVIPGDRKGSEDDEQKEKEEGPPTEVEETMAAGDDRQELLSLNEALLELIYELEV